MSAQVAGEARPSKYDRLIAAAKAVPTVTTIVVHPCDETSLRGAADAAEAGIIKPILVGPASRITGAVWTPSGARSRPSPWKAARSSARPPRPDRLAGPPQRGEPGPDLRRYLDLGR